MRLSANRRYSALLGQSAGYLVENTRMGKLLDNLRKKHAATKSRAGRHAVNFLAHKDEITEALRDGWNAKQVWEQMTEDGMTTMSYSTFCRHVDKYVMPSMEIPNGTNLSADASPSRSSSAKKASTNSAARSINTPKKEPTEKERLDLMKKKAFESVRSPKPAGPLIGKPKTREEEN